MLLSDPGLLTAILTNPIWVVKTRMFTTTADAPTAYRNAFRELKPAHPRAGSCADSCVITPRWTDTAGQTRGTARIDQRHGLGLVWGVQWGHPIYGVRRIETMEGRLAAGETGTRHFRGRSQEAGESVLSISMRYITDIVGVLQSNTEYIIMSGSAKLVAIGITYPYQVVRSRIQVCLLAHSDWLQTDLQHDAASTNLRRCRRTHRYPIAFRGHLPTRGCEDFTRDWLRTQ